MLHQPSAKLFVEEVVVDARHGPIDLHTSSGLSTSYLMETSIGGEYSLLSSKLSVECQYAVLILQNTPYCLEEQIRCLDYRDQYTVLSRRVDTSYPTGGYGVSVDLSEQDT
ncbi:hypothetical protein Tco_0892849 [Tanacetum coccineum]|uniref:Uncharacterized protein n=1 Tax=Tanacetum coccineum TaxID=301880 RepID=A0ABQ5C8T1_9ASTR